MQDVLERLNDVFRDVFEDDDLVISPQTSAEDIAEWDSLMHVSLIVSVESAFGVRFSSAEVAKLKDVGELVGLIESRS